MLELKSIGVLLRDNNQSFPLDTLEGMFGRIGATIHILNHGLPEGKLDLILAMGGDGTVLRALDMQLNCPVLAINYGSVGFLTAGDRTELEQLVSRLIKNDFILSERLVLHCEFPGESTEAFNEVVIRSSWRMINVDVLINDARIRTIRGDGVIVGTPTGSTGYLLSTGGPLVMPDAQCFLMDGLNEYNFTSRPVVLPATARINLRLGELMPEQEAHLFVDGMQIQQVKEGDEILLSKSPHRAQLIFFDENYFFHNLSSRLSWN